jgi:spermidine/putrescine transport system ATP-binding protein
MRTATPGIRQVAEASGRRGEGFLELRELSKSFGSTAAVDGVDLTLAEGEFFSILGPSGCGKTTTLRMVAGFEQPTHGQVLLEGRDITSHPPDKRPINTVFQSYALFSHLDVLRNVAFGLREEKVPKRERLERAREGLSLVRLEGFEARRTSELSGGQQQRVALARAVVKRPRVLLLDEPLGALDLKLRKTMQIELKALQERLGITFVYVTHDQEEALTMSDRIAVMRDGRVCQLGSPEDVYDRPANRYVADFIGASNTLACDVQRASEPDYLVTVHGLALTVSGRPGIPAGKAFLIIRPERCTLSQAEHGPGVDGRVVEVLFKGLHHAYLVELDDGARLSIAHAHRPSAPRAWTVGDRVRVSWSSTDAWLVRD